jgi:hypothetical protein
LARNSISQKNALAKKIVDFYLKRCEVFDPEQTSPTGFATYRAGLLGQDTNI